MKGTLMKKQLAGLALALSSLISLADESGIEARRGALISKDEPAQMVTVRNQLGETITIRVEGKALQKLSELQPGQRIAWSYRDDSQGQHQAIVLIREGDQTQ